MFAAVVLVAVAPGCTRVNPQFCEAATDCGDGYTCDLLARECRFDGRDGGDGTGCTSSALCPDDSPICSPDRVCIACGDSSECADRNPDEPLCSSAGACVECLSNADCTELTAAFCDTDSGTCRGCLDNAECPSEVCGRDLGTCADAAGILYVDNDLGANSDTCGGQSAPCASIGGAMGALPKVGPGRRTIRVRPGAGGYAGALTLDAISVVIVGGGATVSPIVTDSAGITVSGGANVTIEGLTITGASGTGDGVFCTGDGSIVRLTGVVVEQNAGQGVDVEAPCTLRMSRSMVRNNLGGGVRTAGDVFDLANSAIVDNGDAASPIGGLALTSSATSATQRVELCTIAGNRRGGGAGGVTCAGPITIGSSILWGNDNAEASAACSFVYSTVEGGASGEGNLESDPMFVGAGDYHLSAGSPCIDAGDPAAAAGIDIDGQDRPIGGRVDMGADETGGAP